jgi:hypothetical protein
MDFADFPEAGVVFEVEILAGLIAARLTALCCNSSLYGLAIR